MDLLPESMSIPGCRLLAIVPVSFAVRPLAAQGFAFVVTRTTALFLVASCTTVCHVQPVLLLSPPPRQLRRSKSPSALTRARSLNSSRGLTATESSRAELGGPLKSLSCSSAEPFLKLRPQLARLREASQARSSVLLTPFLAFGTGELLS